MGSDKRELVTEHILNFLPLLYKRFFQGMHTHTGITRQQLALLHHVNMEPEKPMNYYGNILLISKPNLTVLVDKLVEDGKLERRFSQEDRRVIVLCLTETGKNYLQEEKKKVKEEMLKKIDTFDDGEIERLNNAFQEIMQIIGRVENN